MSGQQLDFKDLVTVVTGAGGGIGKVYVCPIYTLQND